MPRGFCGIGIENPKNPVNVSTLCRNAHAFNASFAFVIGNRYKYRKADTTKMFRHIPFYQYESTELFLRNIPFQCSLVGVEYPASGAFPLERFVHPERGIYVLGAEDTGISEELMRQCHGVVYVNTGLCMNVGTTSGIILYDRQTKTLNKRGLFK